MCGAVHKRVGFQCQAVRLIRGAPLEVGARPRRLRESQNYVDGRIEQIIDRLIGTIQELTRAVRLLKKRV